VSFKRVRIKKNKKKKGYDIGGGLRKSLEYTGAPEACMCGICG
jgi:hypothetical protein